MARWTFLDLFSGAGGMSLGFFAHPDFRVVGAFDGEHGKPSSAPGSLGCNQTFELNIGLRPTAVDLSRVTEDEIRALAAERLGDAPLDVLSACPPCTGFSRANPRNHVDDDARNNLVVRTALWVRVLRPQILVMENARELLNGRFSHHFKQLRRELEDQGYEVRAEVHLLDRFGLPQRRERALVVAARRPLRAHGLDALWGGWTVRPEAITVRRAIGQLAPLEAGQTSAADPFHTSPGMSAASVERLRAVPKDGGSWLDIRKHPEGARLLTPAMRRYVAAREFGSHPDVYGRLAWDRPAVTIKRECAHVGNGRYSHPEQDRLCTVRELALLQGFPADFAFGARSLSNMYRHLGDAVPPLISYQIAALAAWSLSGEKPEIRDCVLPGTSLRPDDLVPPEPDAPALPPEPDPQQPLFRGPGR